MDLFTHAHENRMRSEAPLAARLRPRTLEEFVGQEDILGPGKLLRRAIEADRLFSSIILWRPPGTGKTTWRWSSPTPPSNRSLIVSHFETLSAVLAGKADRHQALTLSAVIDAALERCKLYQKKTILFMKDVRNHLIDDMQLP